MKEQQRESERERERERERTILCYIIFYEQLLSLWWVID